MPEGKVCPHCCTWKPWTAFWKAKNNADGRDCWCIECKKAYKKAHYRTPEGKAATQRYDRSKRAREAKKNYQLSPRGKAAAKRYRTSEKGRAKQRRQNNTDAGRNSRKRYYETHKKEHKAYYAVLAAVRDGLLPAIRTQQCAVCGNPAMDYHHYLGYEKKHWLDVVPLCRDCHKNTP